MRRLCQKLKSESGASFVLALLFMLICLMVGASILMAASANAGKVRSNQREQQAYMILSSALELVADDLTSKPYYAEFEYAVAEETVLSGVTVTTHTFTCLTGDDNGTYDCKLSGILKPCLNALFAQNMFQRNESPGTYTTVNEFKMKSGSGVVPTEPTGSGGHFTVTAPIEALKDFTVTIDWKLETNYSLYLTARITGVPAEYQSGSGSGSIYEVYEMNAELVPQNEPTILINNSLKYAEYQESIHTAGGKCQSTPLQWEIGWMTGTNDMK